MASKRNPTTFLFCLCSLFVLRTDGCSLAALTLDNGAYSAPNGETTVNIGESISACCNNGFVRMGPKDIQCLSTGLFSEDRPICEDIDECGLGSLGLEIEFIDSSSTGSSSSSAYYYQDFVETPHPLADKLDQETCQGRGLLPPETCHSNARCENNIGSFMCTCSDGYIGDGIHCEEDNEPCDQPVAPDNGYIRLRGSRSFDVECNDGFVLLGRERQTCQLGKWEPGGNFSCIDIRVRCPEPVAPLHGQITHFRGVHVSDYYSVVCGDAYDMIGAGIRQCQRNGEWSGRNPRCKPKKTLGDVAGDILTNIIDPFSSFTKSSTLRQNSARSANVPSLGLDIVLAYDRSSSLDVTDFQLVVNFTKQLLTKFGVSYDEGGTRVAALTFATTAEMAFNYSAGVDTKEKVFSRLDVLKDNIGGGTGLKEGLSMVATELQPTMREGAKHVLFIFTDGQHNTADPFVVASDLKEKNVEIFTVGVGRQINQTALQQIASNPPASHFFYIKTFEDLETLTDLVNSSNIDYKPCGEAGNVLADDDHQAKEKAWPWLSIIHRNSSVGPIRLCSGTLLCQQWVLTTSSCFANIPDAEVLGDLLLSLDEFEEITVTVTLGEHNVSVGEGCEQTINVDRIILHEQYNYDHPHDYDVALLHLSEPVELNSCARTICLPSETDTLHDPTVVGWGNAKGLPQYNHDVPIQFPLPLADQTHCRTSHLIRRFDSPSFNVTDRMLCAGERYGVDPLCQGDHGSPLMYRRSGDDKWAMIGINTMGETCFLFNRYGIYTRIDDDLTQWINDMTSNCANDHIPSETVF